MQQLPSGDLCRFLPRRLLAAVAVAVLPALLVSSNAGAQSRPEGRIEGRNAPPVAAPIADRPDAAAVEMLAAAGQDLAEGRAEAARRTFELLIGRYPESTSALAARRELFRLYAADSSVTGISASQTLPLPANPLPVSPSASELPSVPLGSIATGWRTSVVGFRRLQDDFRNSIGDRIFFSAGSDELGARARTVLAAQAAWLQRRPQVEIIVEGHADDAVAGVDNEAIAARRAKVVRDRLVAEGVEEARIVTAAKGNADPVAVCEDSDCAAQNRRAVIVVGVRRFEAGLAADPHSRDQNIQRP